MGLGLKVLGSGFRGFRVQGHRGLPRHSYVVLFWLVDCHPSPKTITNQKRNHIGALAQGWLI